MPAAPSPRSTKVFSVLNVSKAWFPPVDEICSPTEPPFGASGRT